jgi:Ribosomal protein L20
MARVKTSVASRSRRKKTLKLAKGYYGAKHKLYRVAKQQVMKSHMYAYRDRKQKNVTSVNYGFHVLMLQHV